MFAGRARFRDADADMYRLYGLLSGCHSLTRNPMHPLEVGLQ
jgi:hypothetical protein